MQHIDVIAHRDRQRTTRAPFSDDGTQNRNAQARQFIQIFTDSLGLPAFFRADAGIRARRIDKGHDGQAEFLSRFHQAQGFAVALGARHTEVAADFFFSIAPFLMAYHYNALSVKPCQSAYNRMVVGKMTVSVQFFKIGKQCLNVIQSIGTLRMPGNL